MGKNFLRVEERMKKTRPPMSLFQGQAQKMKLVSKEFSKPDSPGCEERLTLKADGNFTLSSYDLSKTGLKRLSYKETEDIGQERAEFVLEKFSHWFSLDHQPSDVQGDGVWELVLTNREGESFSYTGSLSKRVDRAYYHLSCLLENSLYSYCEYDTEDLLAFTGYHSSKEEDLRRITVDYHRLILVKPKPLQNIPWQTDRIDYSEQLIVDRVSETVEQFQRFGSGCQIHRKYQIEGEVCRLFEDWDEEGLFSYFEKKEEEATVNPKEEDATYRITLEFGEYKPVVLQGSFDKYGLPESWEDFATSLSRFLQNYGSGEILDPSAYNRARRRKGESIFCSVVFNEGSKPYHYLTNDDTLRVDDSVLVPVKSENRIVMASIVDIEYFPEDEAPYPMEKLRRILRKASDQDLEVPPEIACEPLPGRSPKGIRKSLGADPTEALLAEFYGKTSNQSGWLLYKAVNKRTAKAMPRWKKWKVLEEELSARIVEIIEKENGGEPHDGKSSRKMSFDDALFAFMERNGYRDFLSWWLRQENP